MKNYGVLCILCDIMYANRYFAQHKRDDNKGITEHSFEINKDI